MNKSRKLLKSIVLALLTLVLIFGILGAWLYSGELSEAKIKIYYVIPYPLAFLGGKPVLMKDYSLRVKVAQSLNSPSSKKEIYDQLILEEKIGLVAEKLHVKISKKEIEGEYARYLLDDNFKQNLFRAGLSEAEFKNHILKNRLVLNKLKIWFYAQKDLNPQAYGLAESLLQRHKNGEDFAQLAKTFSQDKTGSLTEGDLGFVDSASLLPELREGVENLKDGEAKILTSALGLHIIKQEATNGNFRHLRQIFIESQQFDQWLRVQTQKIKVWSLVKI